MQGSMKKYLARTYKKGWYPAKEQAREYLARTVIAEAEAQPVVKTVRFLTLPSAWWHFEMKMRTKKKSADRGIRVSFTGCESDPSTYRVACLRMPLGKNHHQIQDHHGPITIPGFTNGDDCTLFNANIRDVLTITDKKFHVVWLDFCSPVTENVLAAIASVRRVMYTNRFSVFALTVQGARECIDITRKMGSKPRIQFISDYVSEHTGLKRTSLIQYNESTPMLQMIFTSRGIPLPPAEFDK